MAESVSEERQQQQSEEFFNVLKEIMSLQRERRELLASLTPDVSLWRKRRRGLGEEEETPLVSSRFAAGKEDYTVAAPVVQVETETEKPSGSASTEEEQLGRYLGSVLQDTEDLSHRMLSMANLVLKPTDGDDAAALLSSYMADELVNSTSKLMDACKDLYVDTMDADNAERKPQVEENAFLDFYHKFLQAPLNYDNELALVVTKEEEEAYQKVVEKEKKRAEEVRKENMAKWERWKEKQKETKKYEEAKKLGFEYIDQDKEKEKEEEKEGKEKEKEKKVDPDPATMEYLNKGMAIMETFFADHRNGWNEVRGSKSTRCGNFQDITTLSPMHFTHYTTDTITSSCGVTGSTLQIYSIKILELKKGLKWPLKLYGVVAARDTVDRNRNIVFSRRSRDYQEVGENGSLCLTGPSRAIVALDYVDFEVELMAKEGEESEGKELITRSKRYDGTGTSLMFENSLCKAVLKLERLSRAVQATIVGVCVVEGEWPFEYGCRVACSLAGAADEVVLVDCRGGGGEEEHVGSDGYLHLSRNVVSVQSQGTLKIVIQSYTKSGRAARNWNFDFTAQQCQISERECSVGTCKVKVVVAWSLLVKEKRDLLVDCPAAEP